MNGVLDSYREYVVFLSQQQNDFECEPERSDYKVVNSKAYGSKYWLSKMINSGLLVDELEAIPGVKIFSGTGVPSKEKPSEKSLEKFLVDEGIIGKDHPLYSWWATHPAKKATWDYICLAEIQGIQGIILLEAKAHKGETSKSGKAPPVQGKVTHYDQAVRNHMQIEMNIKDEFNRLGKCYQASINGYYQIANRIAYSSKAHAALGMPVLLVFFGFIGDAHFKDFWTNETVWQNDINACLNALDLPDAMNGEITEIARGGPYVTCLSKRCAELIT